MIGLAAACLGWWFVVCLVFSGGDAVTTTSSSPPVVVATLAADAATVNNIFVVFDAVYYVSSLHYVGRTSLPSKGCSSESSPLATTIVAGVRGVLGWRDDVGTFALFNDPHGIIGDTAGTTLYIADYSNCRVRKIVVDPSRTLYNVTTIAGSGARQNVDGFGTSAGVLGPVGLALHPRNPSLLFVATYDGGAIRLINLTSMYVGTVVKNTSFTPLTSPTYLALTQDGRFIYFCDESRRLVVRVDAVMNATVVETVAGEMGASPLVDNPSGDPSITARFVYPRGVALSADGSMLFVADAGARALRVLRLRDKAVVTIAGNYNSGFRDSDRTVAFMSSPVPQFSALIQSLVPFDTSTFFVADRNNDAIRCINTTTNRSIPFDPFPPSILRGAKSISVRTGGASGLSGVLGVYVHPDTGHVYATHTDNTLRRYDTFTTTAPVVLAQHSGIDFDGSSSVMFGLLLGVAGDGNTLVFISDSIGRRVFLHNLSNGRTEVLAGTGLQGATDGPGSLAKFGLPAGLAFHSPTSTLFVADLEDTIRKIDLSAAAPVVSSLLSLNGAQKIPAYSLALTADKAFLFVALRSRHTIMRVEVSTALTELVAGLNMSKGTADGFGSAAAFSRPMSVVLMGEEYGWPCLYVHDENATSIREIRLRDRYVRTISLSGFASSQPALQGMAPIHLASSGEFGLLFGDRSASPLLFVPLGRPHVTASRSLSTEASPSWSASSSLNGPLVAIKTTTSSTTAACTATRLRVSTSNYTLPGTVTNTINEHHPSVQAPRIATPPLRAALKAFGGPASFTTALVAPFAGFALQRFGAVASFAACELTVEDVVGPESDRPGPLDAPLGLRLGTRWCTVQLGTVVGNAALLAAVSCFSLSVVCIHRRWFATAAAPSLTQSAATLRLPGALIAVVALLLQPLVTAAIQLVVYGRSGDLVTLGIFGLAVVALVVSGVSYVLNPFSFRAVAVDTQTKGSEKATLPNACSALWRWLSQSNSAWHSRVRHDLFVNQYGMLFDTCRSGVHWWLIVDLAVTIWIGVLAAIVPETEAICRGRQWASACGLVVIFIVFLIKHPFQTKLDTALGFVLLFGQTVTSVGVAVGVVSEGHSDTMGLVFGAASLVLTALGFVKFSAKCRQERATESDSRESNLWQRENVALEKLVIWICANKKLPFWRDYQKSLTWAKLEHNSHFVSNMQRLLLRSATHSASSFAAPNETPHTLKKKIPPASDRASHQTLLLL